MYLRVETNEICIFRSPEKKNAANRYCLWFRVNSSDAFVPPKPNEFDKTALIGIFFEAVKGMKASLNMTSGLVRLSVNGATPCNGTQAT